MASQQDQFDTAEPIVPPIQFRLRSLLLFMAACSVALAAMTALGQTATWIIVFALALIVPHLAAAALGQRLKARAKNRPAPSPPRLNSHHGSPCSPLVRSSSRLVGRSAHWSWACLAAVGAVAGVVTGWTVVFVWQQDILASQNLVLALISFAVLGAFVGFLVSSFLHTTLSAINEARHAEQSACMHEKSASRRPT